MAARLFIHKVFIHVHATSAGTISGLSTVAVGGRIILDDDVDTWIYLDDPTSGGTESWSANNGDAIVTDSTYETMV